MLRALGGVPSQTSPPLSRSIGASVVFEPAKGNYIDHKREVRKKEHGTKKEKKRKDERKDIKLKERKRARNKLRKKKEERK